MFIIFLYINTINKQLETVPFPSCWCCFALFHCQFSNAVIQPSCFKTKPVNSSSRKAPYYLWQTAKTATNSSHPVMHTPLKWNSEALPIKRWSLFSTPWNWASRCDFSADGTLLNVFKAKAWKVLVMEFTFSLEPWGHYMKNPELVYW